MQPEQVLCRYGLSLGSVEGVARVAPRILRVTTGRGPLVLKRSRISAPEIRFVHAAQEHLARNGFSDCPRFLLALNGEPFCRVGRELWVVTEWRQAASTTLRRRAELVAAVAKVAELHSSSAGFDPPPEPADRVRWGRWPEILRARLDQLGAFERLARESEARTAFDRLYLGLVDYYWDQAATAVALLLRTPYRRLMEVESLRRSICHHDLTPKNVLFRPDGSVLLLDLDYCICDSRLHDLGSLILRQSKRLGWHLPAAETIIASYSRSAAAPLGGDELAVLAAFLHWPQDFWQVGLQYYVERQPWPLERFLGSLKRKTSRRREREKFLAGFMRRHAPALCP